MKSQPRRGDGRRWRVEGALLLAIGLGAMPLWAGQNQPQGSATAGPGAAGSAPPASSQSSAYQQVPPTLTLPAGSIISIRTSQFLSSDRSRVGDLFNAELEQPLVVHGWVVARRGQTVIGRVAVARKAGRVKGVSQLGIELSRLILVDGQQLPINSELMETSAGTSRGRDAEAVGTTTGLGAVIGAAANGGEGAGIGAAIGAGAGLAGVLLTRGRPTVLPPESALTFQLSSPVSFSTARSQVAFRPVTQADYNSNQAPTLRQRVRHFAGPPPYPPPYFYYSGFYPWGYYSPLFVGFYGFGGYHHGGFRR